MSKAETSNNVYRMTWRYVSRVVRLLEPQLILYMADKEMKRPVSSKLETSEIVVSYVP